MNPPLNPDEEVSPDFERGYREGWHDRGVQQLVIDFSNVDSLTIGDINYLAEVCANLPIDVSKLLEIVQ